MHNTHFSFIHKNPRWAQPSSGSAGKWMSRGPSIGTQDRTGKDEDTSPDKPGDSMKRTRSMCAMRSPANKEYTPRVTPLMKREEKVQRTRGRRAAASGAEGCCRAGACHLVWRLVMFSCKDPGSCKPGTSSHP